MAGDLLHNGLVNSRDPHLLDSGELSRADEAIYRRNDPAPRPAPGRKRLASLPDPKGLRFYQREASSDLLLAHADARYAYTTVGETARSFTTIRNTQSDSDPTVVVPVVGGSTFETAQLGDKIALVNGLTPMLLKDPTQLTTPSTEAKTEMTKLGMRAPTTAPVLSAGAGTWVGDSGVHWWWYTEYNIHLGVESPASPAAAIDPGVSGVLVDLPATAVNPETTEIRVYRSGSTESAAAYHNPFPNGFLSSRRVVGGDFTDLGVQDFSVAFPILVLNVAGEQLVIEKNGVAPTPSTIDVYENSFVANDKDNPTHIRYTTPDEPGTWPDEYFVNLETQAADTIIKLRRVGRVIVALCRNQVVRVNYLPRQGDAEFARGRVWDIISSSLGIASPLAAEFVSLDAKTPVLAFFARSGGLYITDGFDIQAVEADVDWNALTTDYSSVVVRDFAEHQLLAVYYRPEGSASNTKAIYLHYHSSHRKGGRLKATGPITVEADDAVYLPSKNLSRPTMATMAADGTVSLEDRSTPPLPMVVRTRKIQEGKPTDRTHISRLFIRHGTGVGDGNVRLITEEPNALPETLPLEPFATAREKTAMLEVQREVQNYQIEIESYAPISFWIAEE